MHVQVSQVLQIFFCITAALQLHYAAAGAFSAASAGAPKRDMFSHIRSWTQFYCPVHQPSVDNARGGEGFPSPLRGLSQPSTRIKAFFCFCQEREYCRDSSRRVYPALRPVRNTRYGWHTLSEGVEFLQILFPESEMADNVVHIFVSPA